MVVEVERTFEIGVSVEEIWTLIADPAVRAAAISVVTAYEVENGRATWHLKLPIPFVRQTATVRTRDIERDPPRYVRFRGDASVMRVTGEHELSPTDRGCRVRNRFVVEGRVPGVESFFKRNIDGEIENLRRELISRLDADSEGHRT